MNKLSVDDAIVCSKMIEDYYGNFSAIDEYMRDQKLATLGNVLPGMSNEEELFSDFDLPVSKMNFEILSIESKKWTNMVNITSSHINLAPVGRNIELAVREKVSGQFVGFIRIGSPVINCKPRNDLLGQVFSQSKETSTAFNKTTMMGFVIVPAQPFGYNYLGGKLLAGICCSHYIREMLNAKYGMNLCMFETTSLYGNTKSSSQYDGMKPLLRHRGETDSNFMPMINGQAYDDLLDFVEAKVGKLIKGDKVSSKKLKTIMMIVAMIKEALKGTEHADNFKSVIDKAKDLTEQKRYYVSNYGFKNYIDVVNGKTKTLEKDENYDKFKLENIIAWWKDKATVRAENLRMQGRFRKELEVWTSGNHIDIIR